MNEIKIDKNFKKSSRWTAKYKLIDMTEDFRRIHQGKFSIKIVKNESGELATLYRDGRRTNYSCYRSRQSRPSKIAAGTMPVVKKEKNLSFVERLGRINLCLRTEMVENARCGVLYWERKSFVAVVR